MILQRLAVLQALAIALSVPPVAIAQRSSASITPEQILEAMDVHTGGVVCEIGAGDGDVSIAMARLLGPDGRIYASELGDGRISKLRERVAASEHRQITVVAGESKSTNFPEAGCDGLFMRDVYHHFTDPASMNRSISTALKPGGRLVVVDFTPSGAEASQPAGRAQGGTHGVSPEAVTREMKEAGFEPITSEKPGGRWFVLVFTNPKH